MKVFSSKFREMFLFQLVSLAGGLLAGTILAFYTDRLLLLPGMLILLPGFLEMRGNISGSLASRLTSGLFLNFIKPGKINTKMVRGNVAASFILAIVVSTFLGLLAFLFTFTFSGIFLPKIIIIPLLAGVLANLIEIPLTLFLTFYLFRRGHDPNNIMGPLVTTTGDLTSIVSLLVVMVLI